MALIPFEVNNFEADVNEIITMQFYDKPVFRKYLTLAKQEFAELMETQRALMQERDIDSAIGAQLDIIGKIVGQERVMKGMDVTNWFGFLDNVLSDTFGELSGTPVGGVWWSLGQPYGTDLILDDDKYRIMIKAKIIKNTSNGTNEDFIRFARFVLNSTVEFLEDEGGRAKVQINKPLSLFERTLIAQIFEGEFYNYSYYPRPLGVFITIIDGVQGDLGFLDTPGAKGMVSLGLPSDGGIFATAALL